MAVYKVPQDVEAEDKLVGPLSFRQFIYAGIAAGGIALGFFMFGIFPGLALVPLPIVLLFGALALPLRKDQPMETYLLALLRFYIKPKLRMWNPDGTITYVEITAPRTIEQHLIKDYDSQTAQQRLDYLARVMDTRGWALKGAVEPKNSVRADIAAEAQTTNDIMDKNASLSKSIDTLIAKNDQQRKEAAREKMSSAATQPPPEQAAASAKATAARPSHDNTSPLHYNPYPSSMHQKVVHTMEEQAERAKLVAAAQAAAAQNPVVKAMPKQVSPAIMSLVRNGDLSISAIAHEAHRMEDQGEVVINLH
jgi:hypothetical protein